MKSSEVLLAALERMDGGRKWTKGQLTDGLSCCAAGAIVQTVDEGPLQKPMGFMVRTVRGSVPQWNDSAPDFSVIEKGFRDAIALAIAEGD